MSDKTITENDIPKKITGSLSRSNTVVLCNRCKGYGYQLDERHIKHKEHPNPYECAVTRAKCSYCEGDGRLIKTTEHFSLNLGNDKVSYVPYSAFKDIIDPHGYEDVYCRWRIDKSDHYLEEKYPELKAVNYDNYDKLVEKYRFMEKLKD